MIADFKRILAASIALVMFSIIYIPSQIYAQTVLYAVDNDSDELRVIDTTAILVAGAQTNAVWILSALAIIGSVAFGILYLTTKRI